MAARTVRSRGYQNGDVEAMHRLDLECFSESFQFDRATMLEAVETLSAIVVVVEGLGGEMAGFLIVHPEGDGAHRSGYIITIDVAKAARRSGIGATMLRDAEDQARRAGLERMGLHVAVDNAGAISFYERERYERVDLVRGFYREARRDALIYSKEL